MLRWHENLPLLGWLRLGGRCSACKKPIGLRYPLVEGGCGLLFAAVGWHFDAAPVALLWCGFAATLLAASLIDWDTTLLPDDITLPLLWGGLIAAALQWTNVALPMALWGAVAGYLSLWLVYWSFKLVTGKEGMGYGDFKMNAAVGAFLGWKLLPLVILLSSLVGLAFGALQMFAARGRWEAGFRFHFGPYLAIAGIVAMFWGEPIVRWYLQRL